MKVMLKVSVAVLFATLTVACAEKEFDQASTPVGQSSLGSTDSSSGYYTPPASGSTSGVSTGGYTGGMNGPTNTTNNTNTNNNNTNTNTSTTPPASQLSGIELFITQLYDNMFQRKPDIQGYVYWIAEYRRGETGCKNLTLNFLLSAENSALRARANQSARYRSEYIQLAYLAVMNRGADQAGFEYYLNAMNNGLSSEQLELILLDSAEFRARCASYGLRY